MTKVNIIFMQVLKGIVFSIVSSIFTSFLMLILNNFFYVNVFDNETRKLDFLIKNSLDKHILHATPQWKIVIKRCLYKLRGFFLFSKLLKVIKNRKADDSRRQLNNNESNEVNNNYIVNVVESTDKLNLLQNEKSSKQSQNNYMALNIDTDKNKYIIENIRLILFGNRLSTEKAVNSFETVIDCHRNFIFSAYVETNSSFDVECSSVKITAVNFTTTPSSCINMTNIRCLLIIVCRKTSLLMQDPNSFRRSSRNLLMYKLA